MSAEETLRDLYYEKSISAGRETAALSNANYLYRLAKKRDPAINLETVRRFLRNQEVYVAQKEPDKIKKGYSPILAGQPGVALLADVMYLKGPFPYLLVVVDAFSSYTFVRFLRKIKAANVARAFSQILDEHRASFRSLASVTTDRGSEFMGEFDRALRERGVRHFVSSFVSASKTSMPERKIRSLRRKLKQIGAVREDLSQLERIRQAVLLLNNSYSRAPGETPYNAFFDPSVRGEVLRHKDVEFWKTVDRYKRPGRFQPGDRVYYLTLPK